MISSVEKWRKNISQLILGTQNWILTFFKELESIHIVHTLVKVLYAVLRYYRFIYVGRGAKNG